MKPTIEEKYRAALTNPPPRGHRHAALAGICAYAVMCGLGDEEATSQIACAWGYGGSEHGEIRDTLRRARLRFRPKSELLGRPAERRHFQPQPPRQAGGFSADQSLRFVRAMLEVGTDTTSFAALRKRSPTPIPDAGLAQTLVFLKTLYRPTDFLFLGDRSEAKLKTRVQSVECWVDSLTRKRAFGVVVPPAELVSVNRLSGQPFVDACGSETFRCDACVMEGRYVRLEFDNKSLEWQSAFWGGVIATGALPLRSLTYSGGKSLHGILEVNAGSRIVWDEKTAKLETLLCNEGLPDDLKADSSFRHPSHMTRTPGARRRETGNEQSLLWLSPEPLRPAAPPPRHPTPPPYAPTASTPVMAQKEQPPTTESRETALRTIPANGDVYSGLVNYSPRRWRHHEHSNKEADVILNTCADLSPED